MTKVDLYKMRRLIRETKKLEWRIERERSKAERTTAYLSGMPRMRRNNSRVEESAICLADLQEVYGNAAAELEAMRKALDPLIDILDDTDERAVTRLRYMKGFSAEEIAEAVFLTDRMVYYILSRSERKLAERAPDLVRSGG